MFKLVPIEGDPTATDRVIAMQHWEALGKLFAMVTLDTHRIEFLNSVIISDYVW